MVFRSYVVVDSYRIVVMFGKTDLINDLAKESLANWCIIILLCNVHVTFGLF